MYHMLLTTGLQCRPSIDAKSAHSGSAERHWAAINLRV